VNGRAGNSDVNVDCSPIVFHEVCLGIGEHDLVGGAHAGQATFGLTAAAGSRALSGFLMGNNNKNPSRRASQYIHDSKADNKPVQDLNSWASVLRAICRT